MGHIFHDWGLEEKRQLISKAHAALPKGGALIVCEAIIDDQRRQNLWLAHEPEHADRDTSRFRLHRRGLQRLDARRRIQGNTRRTALRPRLNGSWDQVTLAM